MTGQRRGRLKVYMGYAAGVGKTYQMLEEARYPFDKLISKIYPLEKAGEAFDFWYHNPAEVIKILIQLN